MSQEYQVIKIDERTRKVTVDPPFPPKEITGIDKLIQVVVLAILNDPGRSVFDPERGSGIPSMIGTNFDPNDPQDSISRVSERIDKIKDEIITDQHVLTNEDLSELLADLEITNVDTGLNIDSLEVELSLISQSGASANVVI